MDGCIDQIVIEIVGKDSPALCGLRGRETWEREVATERPPPPATEGPPPPPATEDESAASTVLQPLGENIPTRQHTPARQTLRRADASMQLSYEASQLTKVNKSRPGDREPPPS